MIVHAVVHAIYGMQYGSSRFVTLAYDCVILGRNKTSLAFREGKWPLLKDSSAREKGERL